MWFRYIREFLHTSLDHSQDKLISVIGIVYFSCYRTRIYCNADTNNKTDILNIEIYSPCGIVNINSIQSEYTKSWLIVVPSNFSILLHIKSLVMDFSDRFCTHSSLLIVPQKHNYLQVRQGFVLCGSVVPFDHVFQSNVCNIMVYQLNVLKPYTLEIEYEVINKVQYYGHFLQYIHDALPTRRFVNQKPNIWNIRTTFDGIINILRIVNTYILGHIQIFEGPLLVNKKYGLTLNSSQGNILDKQIILNYFTAQIAFEVDSFQDGVMYFDFNSSSINIEYINGSKTISIKHTGHITHRHFKVHNLPEYYVMLSINIREFQGIASHSCNFGGIVLYERPGNSAGVHEYGPYCIPGRDGQPLVSNTGITKLVLPFGGKYEQI